MNPTPFHAYYKARELEVMGGLDRLIAAYSSSDVEIYPYQVSAAVFALRSPYLKGAILCDDVSLGKSIEAMLILTQRWYEGGGHRSDGRRILIVVPTPLLHQWTDIIDSRFSVPLYAMDSNSVFREQIINGNDNPFEQDGLVITTYDFAAEKAEYLSRLSWDLTVFEEAHHLRRIYTSLMRNAGSGTRQEESKGAVAIREAIKGSFKLLLTATPMQNDIMDLYGLIYFIDETALPDADSFYKRYFRKPEHYDELVSLVSRYCFRTTRPQVSGYVKIPERIPMTFGFTLSEPEQRLSNLVDTYLSRDKKYAFPKMERYDLALMLFRILSSSTFALARTLRGIERRLLAEYKLGNSEFGIAEELALIRDMLGLADSITENAKGSALLNALKKGFIELKRLGATRKAIVFTENRETQKYLYRLLGDKYPERVLQYNGDNSRDYTVMEQFRASDSEVCILITTDIAAEGFNLEFCSFVINYDLPYNTLTIEQRIGRCHRQGQLSAVVVVNFLNRDNFADVRLLELINKRILQFDGILGLSDDVIGNHYADVNRDMGRVLAAARTKEEIKRGFDETLARHEMENRRIVDAAEQLLFTAFNREIADSVTVSPRYIEQRVREVNNVLWGLARTYFENYNRKHGDSIFDIDEETRVITARGEPPVLFYYWTGSRNKPYQSLKQYGMCHSFKPAKSRITLSSVIGRGVLMETECADSGVVTVDADVESCLIALYCVYVNSECEMWNSEYIVLVGRTDSGRTLSEAECRDLMAMPVNGFTEEGRRTTRWLRESTGSGQYHELDSLVRPDEFIRRAIQETDSATREEIEHWKAQTQKSKNDLARRIAALYTECNTLNGGPQRASSIAEKVKAEKKKAAAQKELKQREQQLFLDGMRLDLELEEEIKRLTDAARFTASVHRQFAIKVEGNQHG